MAQLLQKLTGNADDLVYGFDHVHGNADGARLIGDGTGDGLTDPPCGIGRELVSFGVVKLFNSLYKTEIALLNKVEEQHASADIALCYRHDQTKVCFRHAALCLLVPLAHFGGKLNLLIGGEQGHLAYLLEVHTNRIVGGIVGVGDYLCLGLDYFLLGDLLYLLELGKFGNIYIVK